MHFDFYLHNNLYKYENIIFKYVMTCFNSTDIFQLFLMFTKLIPYRPIVMLHQYNHHLQL
jgi:hypothetical protein